MLSSIFFKTVTANRGNRAAFYIRKKQFFGLCKTFCAYIGYDGCFAQLIIKHIPRAIAVVAADVRKAFATVEVLTKLFSSVHLSGIEEVFQVL